VTTGDERPGAPVENEPDPEPLPSEPDPALTSQLERGADRDGDERR
jgi:hypothetical protein